MTIPWDRLVCDGVCVDERFVRVVSLVWEGGVKLEPLEALHVDVVGADVCGGDGGKASLMLGESLVGHSGIPVSVELRIVLGWRVDVGIDVIDFVSNSLTVVGLGLVGLTVDQVGRC